MGDDDGWRKFIKANLMDLVESTIIRSQFVLLLYEKGLIDEKEKDVLRNEISPNIRRSATLYTKIANKWNQTQFEGFKKVLHETKNLRALQIMKNFTASESVQEITQKRDQRDGGGDMKDEFDFRGSIKANLLALPKITIIGAELVLDLFQNNLINDEEIELLMDSRTPNINRALLFYTETANKWNQSQFEEFKKALQDTGNLSALQILNNHDAGVFLSDEQVELLTQLSDNKKDGGCYEGLSYKDEVMANKVFRISREEGKFKDGKIAFRGDVDRMEMKLLVSQFMETLKSEKIWWNPYKPTLPPSYIPRRLCGTKNLNKVPIESNIEARTLLKLTTDCNGLVMLANSSGMGKSTEVAKLELDLREKVQINRIIIRVNGSDIQGTLATISDGETTAKSLLQKIAPFLPQQALQFPGISVFVLLDGLDELPQCHQHTTVNLLFRILLQPSQEPISPEEGILFDSQQKIRVVVTTRENLRDTIDSEFQVESWSLIPLSENEKNTYIIAELGLAKLENIRGTLQTTVENFLTKPILLFILVEIFKSEGSITKSKAITDNIFDWYSRFVSAKNSSSVKQEISNEDVDITNNPTLTRFLPFYNNIALNQLLPGDAASEIQSLAPNLIDSSLQIKSEELSSLSTKSELLSLGLVIERGYDNERRLVFKHRSLAEYFYANLLTQVETPQAARDTFFGFLYEQRLERVEEFVKEATKNKNSPISITSKWLISPTNGCATLLNFVDGKLFSVVIRDVLLNFLNGDSCEFFQCFRILVNTSSSRAFKKLFLWMNENRNWTRQHLFKIEKDKDPIFPPPLAIFITAIALRFNYQSLLTNDEVSVAFKSCEQPIIKHSHSTCEVLGEDKVIKNDEQLPPSVENSHGFYYDSNLDIYPKNWKNKLHSNQQVTSETNIFNQVVNSSILGKCLLLHKPILTDHVTEQNPSSSTQGTHSTSFPSLRNFVYFASIAYHDNDYHKIHCDKLESFKFLASGANNGLQNGYYGIAYINQEKRQIIVSHRGTTGIPLLSKAWITNIFSIKCKWYTPRVSSAMTFAHKICKFAKKNNFEVFFTGHSLGGWLAQVTCFSSMYLTQSKAETGFVGLPPPYSNLSRPFTVAFDSPGAHEFLLHLKQSLFSNEVQRDINIDNIPCEVYLFHPNLVNLINYQVGTVFLLDLDIGWWTSFLFMGYFTHSISRVVELVDQYEENAVKWKVIDYRLTLFDVIKNSWKGKNESDGKVGPWDTNMLSKSFFNADELDFLTLLYQRSTSDNGGKFEGLIHEDEKIANNLYHLHCKVEDSKILSEWKNRLEFIPNVKRIVYCLKHGTLWWNPNKFTLPEYYQDRKVYRTEDISQRVELSLIELVERDKFVLLVGPPGTGKSSAMTKLEEDLRQQLNDMPRVIVRLNLNEIQTELEDISNLNITKFFKKCFPHITTSQVLHSLQFGHYPLYILLDGLDEVCPTYEDKMNSILHTILSSEKTEYGKYFSVKLVLTTRPHLQKLIQTEFKVPAHSLLPITPQQQASFLCKKVSRGVSEKDGNEELSKLPKSARDLMSNPLMLFMYSSVLDDLQTNETIDLFSLYSLFMQKKHEFQVVKKEGGVSAATATKTRVLRLFEENIAFYLYVAIKELIPQHAAKLEDIGQCEHCRQGNRNIEKPNENKTEELLRYGLFITHDKENIRFKHRSFAEYVYAYILVNDTTPQDLKNAMFALGIGHEYFRNVQEFVSAVLLKRGKENIHSKMSIVSKGWFKLLDTPHFFEFKARNAHSYQDEGDRFFLSWLKSLNPAWTRQHVFQIDTYSNSVIIAMVPVLVDILFSIDEVADLSRILRDEEIQNSLKNYPDLLPITTKWMANKVEQHFESTQLKTMVERWLGPNHIRNMITQVLKYDPFILEKFTEDFQLSVWCAEVMTKEDMFYLVNCENTRVSDVTGTHMNKVRKCWGEEFLPANLLKFRCKFGHFKGRSLVEMGTIQNHFVSEYFWQRISQEVLEGPHDAIQAVKEALTKNANFGWFFNNLEATLRNSTDDFNLVERLIKEGDNHGYWKSICEFPVLIAPYFILYSNDSVMHSKKLCRPLIDRIEVFEKLAQSLFLSSLSSSSEEQCFQNVRSSLKQATVLEEFKPLVDILLQANLTELKNLISKACEVKSEHGHYGLQRDVPVWEIILLLHIKWTREQEIILPQKCLGNILKGTFLSTHCCRVKDVLENIRVLYSNDNESLKRVLLDSDVLNSIKLGTKWYNRNEDSSRHSIQEKTCALKSILQFYSQVFNQSLEWITKESSDNKSRLLTIPLELLAAADSLSLEETKYDFRTSFEKLIRERFPNPLNLQWLAEGIGKDLEYRKQSEWERLLQILLVVPANNDQPSPSATFDKLYCEKWSPFLRTWTKLHDKDQTRKLTEGEKGENPEETFQFWDFANKEIVDGELLHVAVEIGSLTGVVSSAWPGLLMWRNTNGKTALDIAEHDEEVTTLLQRRINALNKTFTQNITPLPALSL